MPQRKVFTLPNALTGYRFAVVPFIMLCLTPGAGQLAELVAFVLFLSGALTDLADGYLARKMKAESVLGKLMDPLADKTLIAVALIMLIPLGKVAAWVAFVIIARELIITGFRGVAADAGIVIAAGGMGKVKSVFQYIALCILIFPVGLLPLPWLHQLGTVVLFVAMLLTVGSGIEYFVRFQKLYLPSAKTDQ